MIKSIKFQNVFSFKDESELVFSEEYTGNPKDNIFFVLGYNASGKTNLLKSISFLRWFVLYSFKHEPKENLPFDGYLLDGIDTDPSTFEIVFSHHEKTYKYYVKLSDKIVFHEQLWIQNKNERTTFSTIFSRKWDPDKEKYELNLRDFSLSESEISKFLRKNNSLLSVAKYFQHDDATPILDFWENIWTNISYAGRVRNDEIRDLIHTSKLYFDDKAVFEQSKEIIRKLNVGISDIELIEKKDEKRNESYFIPEFKHQRIDSKDGHSLPFVLESNGSKSLFVILYYIIKTLKNGGVAILDEIDGELHPTLIVELLDLFSDKKQNSKGAQIIMSTHNPYLINMVNKQQIIFVEKNDCLESEVYKLSDISGVRNDENFTSKYLAGAYGAVIKD